MYPILPLPLRKIYTRGKKMLKARQIPAAAPCTPVLPFPKRKIYTRCKNGVLLWADMNAANIYIYISHWGRGGALFG